MHKRSVIGRIALVALCLAAPHAVSAQDSQAHQFCHMTEDAGSAGFDRCVARQIAGARAVAQRLSAVRADAGAGAVLIEAYDRCRGLWSPDFGMIEACLEQRLEGALARE